ncbi:MAG TPA: tetratricopeptide repeat protein [Terriglobia bacterium]|jgi:DNA-binding transcriptional MerR regulator|nr:tetratricopeptide repeat protein [Terriglobia bacterium]
MTTLEQFSRNDVLRIVGITTAQLSYWERLRLVDPPEIRERPYSFGDLVRLRTVKQITGQRIPARRLCVALEAVRRQFPGEAGVALTELRFVPAGRRVAVEYHGTRIEPVSGQLLLDFEHTGQPVRVCPMPERSLEDWLGLALDCEGDPTLRKQAIQAYRNIVEKAPQWLEPRLNLGTLCYEDGDWASAAEEFRHAVEISPGNPLAHFNLGSVLDDLGEVESAAHFFDAALRLAPGFADAHYNLARVSEKLGAFSRARAHWRRYIELDPSSSWAEHARQRLADLERHAAAGTPVGVSS